MGQNKTKKIEEENVNLIPLSEAAKLTGYTPEYLNSLSRKGKLKAKKIGRNWHTKVEWVNEFVVSNSGTKIPEEKVSKISQLASKESTKETMAESEVELDALKVLDEITLEEKQDIQKKIFQKKISELDTDKQKNHWIKFFAAATSVVIILPLLFTGTQIAKTYFQNVGTDSELANFFSKFENLDSQIINENFSEGEVAGDETANDGRVVLASENYKIRDLNLGGDVMILANGENQTLEISNIKSESFIAGKKDESKLVISWKTNKEAISELGYSKNGGQDIETVKEDSYGFTHSVVIPGLDSGTSYIFQIKCRDRWGNEKLSDYFGVYTSSKPVSVFELIANALGDVFGWAIKK